MRYFIEVTYRGTNYAGFQVQANAKTIQSEVERAFAIILRTPISLTGSSRTDAGVHAYQNFFHFDTGIPLQPRVLYNLNSLLPPDVVVRSIIPVPDNAHARFMATARHYKYYISNQRDPFTTGTAWYYPYTVDPILLQQSAQILQQNTDFTSFSKRNTQVVSKHCTITHSHWSFNENGLIYSVSANRFLRGMVRGLVGTMLLVGRRKIDLQQFQDIINARDCTKASFATPAHGLFLAKVDFPIHLHPLGA